MKKILVVLAVLALPQVVGLSTVCNAGGRTSCSSNADGTCADPGLPCGAYSRHTGCTTILNSAGLTAANKTPPQGTIGRCVCQ